MSETNPTARGRFAGVCQIARYNWPRYLAAVGVILGAVGWLHFGGGPVWIRAGVGTAALASAWWSATSLGASHWIYDRSELYRWTWIPALLGGPPARWLSLHAGLDESSEALRGLFPTSRGTVRDFFDPAEMSEASIRRARAESATGEAPSISYAQFPFADGTFEAVFVLFAAHELRRAAARETFFRELRRVAAPGGTVLLVEHARDFANFAAFGPGFLHFLPPGEWRRLAAVAGLDLAAERRFTPFVRIFLLRRPA